MLRTIIVGTLLLPTVPVIACSPDRIDHQAKVKWVHDGDTVILESGEKLRLIGLNTPELGKDGKPDRPYALSARRTLQQLLKKHHYRIALRYDSDERDHHGRRLAHPYLPDKTSITAHMLRRGLAIALTVPPNDWNVSCYRDAESQARRKRLGIWSLPRYKTIKTERLTGNERGFRIVEGKILRIGRSKQALWVNLTGNLALRINHEDIANFSNVDFDRIRGKRVIARGWMYKHKRQLRMQIRHPADLEMM